MNDVFNLLITIRNSLISKRLTCKVIPKNPHSCFLILKLLYIEGFILGYRYNFKYNRLYIDMNYYNSSPTINILSIYNKASFPIYLKYTDLCAIHSFGVDVLILSTTQGLMPHYEALKKHLGGQLICYIR